MYTKMVTGDFLLIHYGYHGSDLTPSLTLLKNGSETFEHFTPANNTLTLTFNKAQRYCAGWHNLETAESFPCPDNSQLPSQFANCRQCQVKTGFNPAFYNAASVSPQQQARNAQPHILYLAHFAPGVVKVGITWAERGLRRLLDQGARSCLIIKTYPTATVARQYEARIAALPGIAETLQVKTKHKLMERAYNAALGAQELLATRERIMAEAGVNPDDHAPLFLDSYYFKGTTLNQPIFMHGEQSISGRCLGMIGSTLLTEQNGQQYGLCVSDFIGYPVTITNSEQQNSHKPQQASLF